MNKASPIIGLEVHVELGTKSKMFCGCPAEHFAVEPNTHTCPVCLGLPGALPVPNKKAIEWTILLGLALGCKINEHSKFDRKNYFYPDLSKGYQISQYDEPLCEGGTLNEIRIRRVHLEEDTGKLQHDGGSTLVDFNRSGVPLVEIVTEPDFRSIEEVDAYLKKLQKIIRYLGISGADMEKGSMRLEPSISLSEDGSLPNYRVELKNINSFKFARRALEYEIERQQKEPHVQQTRGWSEAKNQTVVQREKEEANDYRYFPEPDIPPMVFKKDFIEEIRKQIPELPDAKSERFQKDFSLTEQTANQLSDDLETAKFFDEVIKVDKEFAKDAANWIVNKKVDITKVVPAELIVQIKQSKQVSQVNEEELEKIIEEVLAKNQKAIADYKSGKEQSLMFILGQAMRVGNGKLDSKQILEILKAKLT